MRGSLRSGDGPRRCNSLPFFLPSHISLCQLMPVMQHVSFFLPLGNTLILETHRLIKFLFDARQILLKLKAYFGLRECRQQNETGELNPGINLMRLSEATRQFLFYELSRHEFMDADPCDDASGWNDIREVELQQALLQWRSSACPEFPCQAGAINFLTWAQHLIFSPRLGSFEDRAWDSSIFGVMRTSSLLSLALQLQLADRAKQGLEHGSLNQSCLSCPDSLPLRFRAKMPFFVIVENRSDRSRHCRERAVGLCEMVPVQDYSNFCENNKNGFIETHALHFLTWDWALTLEPSHRCFLDAPPWPRDMVPELMQEMTLTTGVEESLQTDLASPQNAGRPSSLQLWWRKWRELVLLGLQEAAGRLQSTESTEQSKGTTLFISSVTPEHAGREMLRAVDRFAYRLVQDEELEDDNLEEGRGDEVMHQDLELWDSGAPDRNLDTDLNSFPLLVARAARLLRDFSVSEWCENPYLDWHVSQRLAEAAFQLGFEDFASLQMEVREQIRRGELGHDMDLVHPGDEQPS
eukprot:TRINITY_DN21193_c0_g1_i1.p1 TRINITY_DN21193_c0_g1~~TRINITY_DN21193_c0_g1_i1.p1  ORF type:complete len:523 (-),score=68.43 TRINITY_DN21193_c0_g1_i1:102-1670(-)